MNRIEKAISATRDERLQEFKDAKRPVQEANLAAQADALGRALKLVKGVSASEAGPMLLRKAKGVRLCAQETRTPFERAVLFGESNGYAMAARAIEGASRPNTTISRRWTTKRL